MALSKSYVRSCLLILQMLEVSKHLILTGSHFSGGEFLRRSGMIFALEGLISLLILLCIHCSFLVSGCTFQLI
ncbi:hypothetical protein D3C76_1487300 [compost metagenome]